MKRNPKDPYGALRKTAIAILALMFLSLAFFFILFSSVLKRVEEEKERERSKAATAPAPAVPTVEAEDAKEAERWTVLAVEHARNARWDRLEELSREAAGMSGPVRDLLVDRWFAESEKESLLALAGLLTEPIRRAGKDAERMWNRMSTKLAPLCGPLHPPALRRVALRATAAFPGPNVESRLFALCRQETDPGNRAMLAESLAATASDRIAGIAWSWFEESSDPETCAQAALLLAGIHERHPLVDFEIRKKETLLPKLRKMEDSETVRRARDRLGP